MRTTGASFYGNKCSIYYDFLLKACDSEAHYWYLCWSLIWRLTPQEGFWKTKSLPTLPEPWPPARTLMSSESGTRDSEYPQYGPVLAPGANSQHHCSHCKMMLVIVKSAPSVRPGWRSPCGRESWVRPSGAGKWGLPEPLGMAGLPLLPRLPLGLDSNRNGERACGSTPQLLPESPHAARQREMD